MVLTKDINKIIEEYNLGGEFKLEPYYLKVNGEYVPTTSYAVLDQNDNLIRNCKKDFVIIQNKDFVKGIEEIAVANNFSVLSYGIFENNNGIYATLELAISIPKNLNKIIQSIECIIIDGNSQQFSLSSGLKINFFDGAYTLLIFEDGRSNKRSTTHFNDRKGIIPTLVRICSEKANDIIKTFGIAFKSNAIDNKTFIKENYGDSKRFSSKMESTIIDIETNFYENSIKYGNNLLIQTLSFMEIFYKKGNEKGDIISYLFTNKSRKYITDIESLTLKYIK